MFLFIQTITAILNDFPDIPGLHNDELMTNERMTDDPRTVRMESALPDLDKVKIARLQTLIFREAENTEIPSHEEITRLSGGKQDTEKYGATLTQFMCLKQDALDRIALLERLIIEIVRAAVPAEVERFGVTYILGPDMHLYRSAAVERSFLD